VDADIVLTRDLAHYDLVWASLVVTFVWIGARRRRPRNAPMPHPLAGSSAAWFTPVYLWGIASVLHSQWWLTAGFRGIAPHPYFFTRHGTFSMGIGLLVVVVCLLAEAWGRAIGLPARAPGASVPAPVVAALLSVAANWWLKVSVVFYPLHYLSGPMSH
jgi:hypothetical protein